MINFSKPKHLFVIGLGYIIFLFTLLGVSGFFSELDFIFGVNKTIGLAWDLVASNAVFFLISQIIAVTGYGFLWLFKCRVNSKISIFHSLLIVLMLFSVILERNVYWGFTIEASILIVITAVLNAVFAFYYKMSDKKKRIHN